MYMYVTTSKVCRTTQSQWSTQNDLRMTEAEEKDENNLYTCKQQQQLRWKQVRELFSTANLEHAKRNYT